MRWRSAAAVFGAFALVSIGGTAWAAPPYHVEVGTFTSGEHGFTADSVTAVDIVIGHGATTVPLDCSSIDIEGYVTAGANSTGDGIGTIQHTDWVGCLAPFMQSMHLDQIGDWALNAYGDATSASTDDVDVWVGDIALHVYAGTSPSACDYYVSGIMTGHLDEASQQLVIDESGATGNLYVSSVIGNCLGLVGLNDPLDLTATFALDPPDGAVNIIEP